MRCAGFQALLVLLSPGHVSTTGTTSAPYQVMMVNNGDDCQGYEIVDAACPGGMPPCPTCTPTNCVWNPWTQWVTGSTQNCNQKCHRSRTIKTFPNKCGQGCQGGADETKVCPLAACQLHQKDCQLGQWSQWTPSACNDVDQKTRTRSVIANATHGGKACTNATVETYPCGTKHPPQDCKFTDWRPWTQCSRSCGMGVMSRNRRWAMDAMYGGKPCDGSIHMLAPCNLTKCAGAIDCEVSPWSQWTGCDCTHAFQRTRTRQITKVSANGGNPCPATLKEADGCNKSAAADTCTFTPWAPWGPCDTTCDWGQQRRDRKLLTWLKTNDMSNCPNSVTQETRGCTAKPCPHHECKVSAWSVWGPCRPDCNTGMKSRNRTIVTPVLLHYKGCTGVLQEIVPCFNSPACVKVDCVWGDWQPWGACTTSCGGGTNRRVRKIKIPCKHGGLPCYSADTTPQLPFSQIAPCNIHPCNSYCVNGTYGGWTVWSKCSATCGTGVKSRRRELSQAPNTCGHPAIGDEEQYETCMAGKPCEAATDCKLSQWTMWGQCSASCFGLQERTRLVATFATGDGKACNTSSLQDMRPCNPGPNQRAPSSCAVLPNVSCELTIWGQWSECPVTCGGGQHMRHRHVRHAPSGGGLACTAELAATRSCNTNKCGTHCIDCHWGQWSDWGSCTICGGQRYRTRRVEQLPNHCGTMCASRVAQETAKCPVLCNPPRWCMWADWSPFSPCSATCGGASKQRQRNLEITKTQPPPGGYLFIAYHHMMCAGSRFETAPCAFRLCSLSTCTPMDCVFSAWSPWAAPQMTGLCQRNRAVQSNNNKCGKPCHGVLVETKACIPKTLLPQDCKLGNWGSWSACASMVGQKYKIRGVYRQAANGGTARPCTGSLREVASCLAHSTPIDCGFTPWTDWSSCTETCFIGWKYRTRQGNHPQMENGGQACVGPMKEMKICRNENCTAYQNFLNQKDTDCKFSPWSAFGICDRGQKSRFRMIKTPAQGSGTACSGPLEDTCHCKPVKIDCQVLPWSAWDQCDKQCAGGQTNRHRMIGRHPQFGGKACPKILKETQGCNVFKCTGLNNCQYTPWSGWNTCSAQCGIGQSTRTRNISKYRAHNAFGCKGNMTEVKPCGTPSLSCPPVNCTLGAWSQWSQCVCNAGYHQRTRGIATFAGPLGKPCSNPSSPPPVMGQTKTCPIQPCGATVHCYDGNWSAWSPWSACSSQNCPGVQRRNRTASHPNYCGKAALGLSAEIKACNVGANCGNVPCLWGDWAPWHACSRTCNGQTQRTRVITQYGKGTGAWCNGPMLQLAQCAPNAGQALPQGCPIPAGSGTACKLSVWTAWTACTRSCDGGTHNRSRKIATPAQGGQNCVGSLFEVGPCQTQNCPTGPKNCKFSDWGDWGGALAVWRLLNDRMLGVVRSSIVLFAGEYAIVNGTIQSWQHPEGCQPCDGTELRKRHIAQEASNGGAPCNPKNASDMRACPRNCNPPQYYCVWGSWQDWSQCSRTCGTGGRRTRKRQLMKTTMIPPTPAPAVVRKLGTHEAHSAAPEDIEIVSQDEDWQLHHNMEEVKAMRKARVAKQGDMRVQEIAMAFVTGGASMFLLLGAFRLCSRAWPTSADQPRQIAPTLLHTEGSIE